MDTRTVLDWLRALAPLDLAEAWDNVGLLVGRGEGRIERVLTCLTLTPDVAAEAVARRADLVVSHHPLLFRPVQRLTDADVEGAALLDLIGAGVRVYSPHTGWDSAREGINAQLAGALGLRSSVPLRPHADDERRGAGRCGVLSKKVPLHALLERVKQVLRIATLPYVGDLDRPVKRVGIACGAADDFLADARRLECDALLLGEARFHTAVAARSAGVALLLPGHYATERPAMEELARRLAEAFPELEVWASAVERDPLRFA